MAEFAAEGGKINAGRAKLHNKSETERRNKRAQVQGSELCEGKREKRGDGILFHHFTLGSVLRM